ncbi:MAG: hypothetical protein DRN08_00195 [Thermoplasmata archaeon]|nr:MAG: hypothetical protein DRN08_00195 [Thermoplasmata archaeon]
MRWKQSRLPFLIIIILSLLTLVVSVWDLLFEKGFFQQILAGYMILFILSLVLLIVIRKKTDMNIGDVVEEFEKTLKGRLYHFKCPSCGGIFAIKKSKYDNKREVRMTCPDCGRIGVIPSNPLCIEADIPEKKSVNINFICQNCGEKIAIWAEGSELYHSINVYSCPYCGGENTMTAA